MILYLIFLSEKLVQNSSTGYASDKNKIQAD